MSKKFLAYLEKKGIRHLTTNRDSPQQNGIAERFNKTVNEHSDAQLAHANLPRSFWSLSAEAAVYVINQMPGSHSNWTKTPYELFFGQRPNVANVRVFGCDAYVHIPKARRHKGDPPAEKCIHVGYTHNGYQCWSVSRNKIVESRDVQFHESIGDVLVRTPSRKNHPIEPRPKASDEPSEPKSLKPVDGEESDGSVEYVTPPTIKRQDHDNSSSESDIVTYRDSASEYSLDTQSEIPDGQLDEEGTDIESVLDESDIGSIATEELFNTPDLSELDSDQQSVHSEVEIPLTSDAEAPSAGSASESDVNQSGLDGQYW